MDLMRTLYLVAVLLLGCQFEHGELVIKDAPPQMIDAPVVDARPIDAPGPDARSCAPAPAGCKRFTCSDTSSCYYVCGDTGAKATWGGAKAICESPTFGGCILTIDSMDEQNCMFANTTPTGSNLVWFGYRQDASPTEPAGDWKWECGSSAYVQFGWANLSGQPDDATADEDCGALSIGGLWTDASCSGTARYVCEVP
jgi:hypothetical protein